MTLHYNYTQLVLARDLNRVTQNVPKLYLDTTNTVVSQVCYMELVINPVSVLFCYNVSFVNRLNTCSNI